MRVTDLRTVLVEVPLAKPTLNSSGVSNDRVRCVLVYIDTDVGVTGESFLFTNGGRRIEVLEAMVTSLRPALIGEDIRYAERVWERLFRELYFLGHKGVTVFGLSAIDTALWDAKGKALGQSLAHMLGAAHTRIPVYTSNGLWLSATPDELATEAKGYVAQGFGGVKMRVGKKHVEEDVERVAAVRKAIGARVPLMCDASRGFTATTRSVSPANSKRSISRGSRSRCSLMTIAPRRRLQRRSTRHSPAARRRRRATVFARCSRTVPPTSGWPTSDASAASASL